MIIFLIACYYGLYVFSPDRDMFYINLDRFQMKLPRNLIQNTLSPILQKPLGSQQPTLSRQQKITHRTIQHQLQLNLQRNQIPTSRSIKTPPLR